VAAVVPQVVIPLASAAVVPQVVMVVMVVVVVVVLPVAAMARGWRLRWWRPLMAVAHPVVVVLLSRRGPARPGGVHLPAAVLVAARLPGGVPPRRAVLPALEAPSVGVVVVVSLRGLTAPPMAIPSPVVAVVP